MKLASIYFICSLLFISCERKAQTMDDKPFKAEKATKTASIIIDNQIEKVFPLFGAFEERKWAEGWNPTLIYPTSEIIEEGTTFKTNGHGHNENEFIWRVSKYEPANYLIQYLVTSENRYWTITVKCSPTLDKKTTASITYTFIGLNELGNQINKHSIEKMYQNNLSDWQEEINNYIKKTKE